MLKILLTNLYFRQEICAPMSAGSLRVVRYTNYCKLWGMRTGRRCHVEFNENKPFEFVGEDIILPQEIRLKPYNTK